MTAKFRPSVEQCIALSRIKVMLADRGYLIFPVADWYRRHVTDFVAMPKEWPRNFAVVRASAGGAIVVRPFAEPKGALYRMMPELKKDSTVPVKRGLPPLKYSAARPDWWLSFVPRELHHELELLAGVAPDTARSA